MVHAMEFNSRCSHANFQMTTSSSGFFAMWLKKGFVDSGCGADPPFRGCIILDRRTTNSSEFASSRP